jgi:hypothetical protein
VTLTLEFPAVDVPAEVPVLEVRPPEWTLDAATELAKGMHIAASAADSGLWLLARDDRAALEVYRASSSFRYSRLDLDGEGRDGIAGVPEKGAALDVGQEWISQYGPEGVRAELHSVTEREVLISQRPDEVRQLIVGLDVNFRFSVEGLPLFGPGAKAQVSVHPSGEVTGAYRFWREVHAVDAAPTVPVEQMRERFASSPLFVDLTDDVAHAHIDSARFGWLSLPPSEPMGILVAALELRGMVYTEDHTYNFISFVGATDSDDEAGKRAGWVNTRPRLLVA